MALQSSLLTPASREGSSGTSLAVVHWYDAAKANTAGTVQAVAAVVAVVFAYRTVRIGFLAFRDHRRIKELERRQAYFDRYMLDVAMQCVPAFRERATRVIRDAAAAVAALSPHSEQQEVNRLIAKAIESFSEQIHQLRERLFFADTALGDTSLWPTLEEKLSALEDEAVHGIEQFAISTKRNASLDAVVGKYSAMLLREIYHYDILVHTIEDDVRVAWWRKVWRVGIVNLARRIQKLA
ncbi:MAG TPA: hypothetical protein VIQ76_15905 [Propionibacteriaceae bacterium]